jgi:hypothetical protein
MANDEEYKTSDSYRRGYAHGCKAVQQVYEAMLDDLKRHTAAKVAHYFADSEQRVAELESQMRNYATECERRLAEAAERYGVDVEPSSAPRQH